MSGAGFDEADAAALRPSTDHAGHRDRLRDRFARAEDALPDYEVLELLLFRLIPRRDTKPIARDLLRRFGSLKGIFAAPKAELMKTASVGERVAQDLRVIGALHTRMLREVVSERPVLGSWSAVVDYLTAQMAHRDREQLRILYLDKKNNLIVDEMMHEGTVDHTAVYPREVVRRALELASTAIIVVHNHPSGDPTPSQADIEMTRMLVETCSTMDIIVHDHIVVGKKGHASFKGLGLM